MSSETAPRNHKDLEVEMIRQVLRSRFQRLGLAKRGY